MDCPESKVGLNRAQLSCIESVCAEFLSCVELSYESGLLSRAGWNQIRGVMCKCSWADLS